jgi:predicted Zn-ribbon and HTH transcriptional regulator
MKKMIKEDGKVVLTMSKAEWEKIGKDKGWGMEAQELEKSAQASPKAEQAPEAPEASPAAMVVCKVCSYANRPEAFGAGSCPKCGSTFLDR